MVKKIDKERKNYKKIKKLLFIICSLLMIVGIIYGIKYVSFSKRYDKVKNEINYMNDYKEVIDEICSLNDIESLGKKIKIVENVKNELGLNANMKLLFDKLIIELSEV